jgi:hypothetical protein
MNSIRQTTGPVFTNNDINVEYLIYIKYKWGNDNCIPDKFIICPPGYGEWRQIVTYLGYNLKDKEMDFIYGGFKDSIVHMIDNLYNYFNPLKAAGIIEYYTFDIKYNSDYCYYHY